MARDLRVCSLLKYLDGIARDNLTNTNYNCGEYRKIIKAYPKEESRRVTGTISELKGRCKDDIEGNFQRALYEAISFVLRYEQGETEKPTAFPVAEIAKSGRDIIDITKFLGTWTKGFVFKQPTQKAALEEREETQTLQPYTGKIPNFFLVRYGNYDETTGSLTPVGIEDMKICAGKISSAFPVFPESEFYILSSIAPHAMHSATFLHQFLKRKTIIEGREELRVDGSQMTEEQGQLVDKVLEQERGDRKLIVVSHLPLVRDYPPYLMERLFRQKQEKFSVSYGNGFSVDLEKRTVSRL